jgi:hypothetical protein
MELSIIAQYPPLFIYFWTRYEKWVLIKIYKTKIFKTVNYHKKGGGVHKLKWRAQEYLRMREVPGGEHERDPEGMSEIIVCYLSKLENLIKYR